MQKGMHDRGASFIQIGLIVTIHLACPNSITDAMSDAIMFL